MSSLPLPTASANPWAVSSPEAAWRRSRARVVLDGRGLIGRRRVPTSNYSHGLACLEFIGSEEGQGHGGRGATIGGGRARVLRRDWVLALAALQDLGCLAGRDPGKSRPLHGPRVTLYGVKESPSHGLSNAPSRSGHASRPAELEVREKRQTRPGPFFLSLRAACPTHKRTAGAVFFLD